MEVNINQECTVVLNERGIEALEAHYGRLGLEQPEVYEVGDNYTAPLWDIMFKFGNYCYMGPKPPFEVVIKLKAL